MNDDSFEKWAEANNYNMRRHEGFLRDTRTKEAQDVWDAAISAFLTALPDGPSELADVPTPRVDEASYESEDGRGAWVVDGEFARTLERETIALKAQLSGLSDPATVLVNMMRGTIAIPERFAHLMEARP